MSFTVPPLPYDYNALEPHIDEQTMRLHHDKHHQAYVDNASKGLQGTELDGKPVEEVLASLSSLPADRQTVVRNNGGGHANHTLFWESMSPDGGGAPTGELADDIAATFGSFDAFQEQFEANGVAQFGSGWTWLVLDGHELKLTRTPNQDSPILEGHTPLLGNDIWEHAYYLKYQNRRPEYLKAWWNVANWDKVAERYAAAKPAHAGSRAA
jgi:Fe-Mn family superoxide dismutase